jgi:hypothetical protein
MPSQHSREVRKSTLAEQGRERDLVGTTPEERIGMMWQLTVNAWAMMGVDLRGSRLQRHVERVVKRKKKSGEGL